MSELVQSAIDKLNAGDAQGFRTDIRTSLMDRLGERLDILRAEVGVSMFGGTPGEDSEAEAEETSSDEEGTDA